MQRPAYPSPSPDPGPLPRKLLPFVTFLDIPKRRRLGAFLPNGILFHFETVEERRNEETGNTAQDHGLLGLPLSPGTWHLAEPNF